MAKQKEPSPLDSTLRHYDAGDVRTARREAQALLKDPPSDEIARLAAELLERTKLPRLAWGLAGLAVSLILGMILLATLRAG